MENVISYKIAIEGNVKVKNTDEFYSALSIGAKILITKPNTDLLDFQKYNLNISSELKDKDPLLFEFLVEQKLLKDYVSNGELKEFVEEVLSVIKNKKKKEEIINSIKEDPVINPVSVSYKVDNIISTLKKFKSLETEIKENYYDTPIYIKIFSNGLPFYEVYLFLTEEKPRIGLTVGEIMVNPKEIISTAINEDKIDLEEMILRKVLGKIVRKNKGPADAYTSEFISYLRYTYWGLRSSDLTIGEIIGLLPAIFKAVKKPKELLEETVKAYKDFQNNINRDKIFQEIKDLGWFNIILPQNIQQNDKNVKKLNKFFKLGTEIGNVGLLLFSLLITLQTVYEINGVNIDKIFKELV